MKSGSREAAWSGPWAFPGFPVSFNQTCHAPTQLRPNNIFSFPHDDPPVADASPPFLTEDHATCDCLTHRQTACWYQHKHPKTRPSTTNPSHAT
ncbi:hypothetical protein Hypma_002401 [Hypsizygus marmoreus]|uniref:Uncharacterized protein n=1 Tax=Hypsizygus marmoreus TaxID=39966 RepID=A0A369J4F6_HYPMA|nr:hypothetical protein Hypma_002401 [Hypsizygus marmoreus]